MYTISYKSVFIHGYCDDHGFSFVDAGKHISKEYKTMRGCKAAASRYIKGLSNSIIVESTKQ